METFLFNMEDIELLEGEIWKDVPNYDGYLIINYARVYSKVKKKLLSNHKDRATLFKEGIRTDVPLLKLMREVFPDEQDLSEYSKVKDLPNELWLPVKGYEDIYHISNMGRLKVLDRVCWVSEEKKNATRVKREHISARCDSKTWYPSHILIKGDSKVTKTIHRLVAEHFIPNPENKPQVNHINGLKYDNRVENLEWVTAQENSIHAYATGLSKAKSIINDEIAREIKILIRDKEQNKLYLRDIANMFGITRHIAKDISRGRTWNHIII